MKPYYQDEWVTIYHGDCREILPELPKVDLVLTDPPYSIGTTSTGTKGSWLDNNLVAPFFEIWAKEIKRKLSPCGEFYIHTDWRTYPFIYPIIYQAGLIIKNCIVWDYEWIKAGSHYRFSHEFIIYGIGDMNKRQFPANCRDVWRIAPINFTNKNKSHQTEKPLDLEQTALLNSSKERDLVLDTFLGSGTTALACKLNNRKCIGIEIEEKYCEIAAKRCSQGVFDLR